MPFHANMVSPKCGAKMPQSVPCPSFPAKMSDITVSTLALVPLLLKPDVSICPDVAGFKTYVQGGPDGHLEVIAFHHGNFDADTVTRQRARVDIQCLDVRHKFAIDRFVFLWKA